MVLRRASFALFWRVSIPACLSSSVGESDSLCLLKMYLGAFLWTPSSFLISLLVKGNQTTFAYSTTGLTNVSYASNFISDGASLRRLLMKNNRLVRLWKQNWQPTMMATCANLVLPILARLCSSDSLYVWNTRLTLKMLHFKTTHFRHVCTILYDHYPERGFSDTIYSVFIRSTYSARKALLQGSYIAMKLRRKATNF